MSIDTNTRMGKVLTKLKVTNRADQVIFKGGFIPDRKVRSVGLENVLVDTGAITLCLPADIIQKLGLELLKTVPVAAANGVSEARVFQDARISLCGREGAFECLELPGGQSALIGVIPLEMLGLEPDLQNQTLRKLPLEMSNTYITIL